MDQELRTAPVGTIAFSGSILSLDCFLLRYVPKLSKKRISPVAARPSPSANESRWVAWVTGGDERGTTGREVGTIITHHELDFFRSVLVKGDLRHVAHLLMTSSTN